MTVRETPGDKARKIQAYIRSISDRAIHYDRVEYLKRLVSGKRLLDIGCVDHAAFSADRHDWLHKQSQGCRF